MVCISDVSHITYMYYDNKLFEKKFTKLVLVCFLSLMHEVQINALILSGILGSS